jgi:SOS-response transcriptional repressor LexA
MIMEDFPLSPNQVKVLKYITKYYKQKQYMPSYREIMAHTKHRSTSRITAIVEQLKERGYIENKKYYPRSLKIIKNLS